MAAPANVTSARAGVCLLVSVCLCVCDRGRGGRDRDSGFGGSRQESWGSVGEALGAGGGGRRRESGRPRSGQRVGEGGAEGRGHSLDFTDADPYTHHFDGIHWIRCVLLWGIEWSTRGKIMSTHG